MAVTKVRIPWNILSRNLKGTGPYSQASMKMSGPPEIGLCKDYVQKLEDAYSNTDQTRLLKLNFQQETLRKTQHPELETLGYKFVFPIVGVFVAIL